jgi:hypothetical protein
VKVVKLQTTKIIVDFVFQRAVPKLLVFLPVFYLHLQIWNIGRGTGEANIACCFANYFENTEDTVISRAVTNEPFNNSVICDIGSEISPPSTRNFENVGKLGKALWNRASKSTFCFVQANQPRATSLDKNACTLHHLIIAHVLYIREEVSNSRTDRKPGLFYSGCYLSIC